MEGGVDAAVIGNDLGETVYIGGFQLGELTVVEDRVHNGGLAPELLQHLGGGGVARFGLLHRGNAHVLKEELAQLLGRVDVELPPECR